MPGPVCKVIIDSGRLLAAIAYSAQLVASTAKMVGEAILRKVLSGDDPRVTEINQKLCYWAEEVDGWNAELFKLASEIAASPPLVKKAD